METETKARHIENDKVGRSGSLRKRVRPLTYDEHKAAEAAFTGEPCDPAWTQSAQRIYEGLLEAKTKLAIKSLLGLLPEIDENALAIAGKAPHVLKGS